VRPQRTLANNLLVCRNCAFNFDTPGTPSDVEEAIVAPFFCFDGLFEEEAPVRDGPIRDRVERKCSREKNLRNPSPPFLFPRLCISRFYPLNPLKMRNLGLRAVHNIAFPNANLSAVAIDLEEDAIYVASERQNADANIEVEIFKLGSQQCGVVRVCGLKPVPTTIG